MPKELQPKTSTLLHLFIVMTPRRDDIDLSKLELGSTNPKVVEKQINSIKKQKNVFLLKCSINEWSGLDH